MVSGLSYGLDGYPLLDPDEGRNAEVAREMATTNDYVLPHLNGLPYVDKPFLFFGATALAMEILGPTPVAARLVPFLFTLVTMAILAWFGNHLYGRAGGLISAVATGSMPLTLGFARTVIMDSALTTFVVAAIVCFYCAIEADDSPAGRERGARWGIAGWVMLAFGVFTKGPIALGLPLMVTVPYALWRKRGRIVFDPVAVLAFVAMMVPWLAIVSRDVPDFLHYALITETMRRFATTELQRAGPWWYFLPILVAGALPWSLVLLTDWRRSAWRHAETGRLDARVVFAMLWIIVPVIFFSLSQSKRPQYLVPVIPAIALLVAGRWSRPLEALPGLRRAAIGLFLVGGVVGASPHVLPSLLELRSEVIDAVRPTASWLGGVSVATAIAVWFAHGHRTLAITLLAVPVAAIPPISMNLMRTIGEERSSYHAATAIMPLLTPDTDIVAVHTYPLSLPFYLDRTLTLSTEDAAELTSNYLPPRVDRFMRDPGTTLRPQDWWIEALTTCSRSRIFVAASDDHNVRNLLGQALPLIVETDKVAAYGPCRSTSLATRVSRSSSH